MGIFKNVLSDGLVCLHDEGDNFLFMKYYENNARIISASIDKDIALAAEQEAVRSGKNMIICDFPSGNPELEKVFLENKYFIDQGNEFISVRSSELFESTGVVKSMQAEFSSCEFVPLRDMLLYQIEQLAALFENHKIPLTSSDIVRFDNDLSGVVYNNQLRPQAVVLASVYGTEVMIDFLYGFVKDKPQIIMAALQGFAKEFAGHEFVKIYDTVAMLRIRDSILPLLKKLLDKGYEIVSMGRAVAARKVVGKDSLFDEIEIIEEPENSVYASLLEGIDHYQHNLNWKMQWVEDVRQ